MIDDLNSTKVRYQKLFNATCLFLELNKEIQVCLNEAVEEDFRLGRSTEQPYVLKYLKKDNIEFFNLLWFGSLDVKLEDGLNKIVKSFRKDARMTPSSAIMVGGRLSTSGDDTLITAWEIYRDISLNIYLIVAISARCHDINMYIYEGELSVFFNKDMVGRGPRSDSAKEMEVFEPVMTVVNKKYYFEDLGIAFRDAIKNGVIRTAS